MVSDNKSFQLSESQALRDNAFLNRVKSDFLESLWDELKEIDGYDGMTEEGKVAHIVKTNKPYFGKGDSLPFGITAGGHVNVYAGTQLGREWYLGNQVVCYYRPRFFCSNLGEHGEGYSKDMRSFLYDEHEKYESLPVAYKAALLCQYIYQNIVCEMRYITLFVIGHGKNLHPKRVEVDHVADEFGKRYCWALRIRDVRPSVEFGKNLASFLRWEPNLYDTNGFKGFETPAPRASDSRSELAYAYIAQLIADGVSIGRGGDMSWDDAAAKLVATYGNKVRSYTGNNLRDGFRKWNQRREGR